MRKGRLHITTNGLSEIDSAHHPAVISAIGVHLGFDPSPLRKALVPTGEGEDPRFPELHRLIGLARKSWSEWGTRLVEEVRTLLDGGRLLPMSTTTEGALLELLQDHEVALVAKITGRVPPNYPRFDELVRKGLVQPNVKHRSLIDLSYRVGRGLEQLKAYQIRKTPPLAKIIEQAMSTELSDTDLASMDYAKRKAAVYMRRPAEGVTTEIQRILTEAEHSAIRGATEKAVEKRWGAGRLAQELRAVTKGPSLQNDFDRVARTELVFAHNHGAYEKLKTDARAAGEDDPWVFKMASPQSCKECRRIWGETGASKRYRLSTIEKREAGGGNFKKPRAAWGPTVGPIHPNCTCGPLQYWAEGLVESIDETVAEIMQHYRG